MAKEVMDIHPTKGISYGESAEHQRLWSDKQWANKLMMQDRNYDRTRAGLDFEIVNGEVRKKIDTSKTEDQKMRDNCKARGMRWPNDPNPRRKPGEDDSKVKERIVGAQIIFQGDRVRMHEIAFGGYGIVDLSRGADNSKVEASPEIYEWAKDNYDFVARHWGAENICSFICHLDETNPHIHCTLLPVTKVKGKDRISWNKVFGGDKEERVAKWKGYHDLYYAEVGKKWGLERGEDTQKTGAKHRTAEQYRYDLWKEVNQLRKDVDGLNTTLDNLTSKQYDLESEIEGLKNDKTLAEEEKNAAVKAKNKELADLQSQIDKTQSDLDEKNKDLKQKEEEIATKTQTSKNLDDDIASKEQRVSKLEQEEKTAETRVKGLTTMTNNLLVKKSNLEGEIERLKNDKTLTEEEKDAAIKTKNKELADLQSQIDDKNAKLDDATNKLTNINNDITEAKKELAEIKSQQTTAKEGIKGGWQVLKAAGANAVGKLSGKEEQLREEGRQAGKAEVIKTLDKITGGFIDDDGDPIQATPEMYGNTLNKYRKDLNTERAENKAIKSANTKLLNKDGEERSYKWLFQEMMKCPDRQMWSNLKVYSNDFGWRCSGEYCGMSFNKTLGGALEDHTLKDVLTTFDYNMQEAGDMELRSTVAELFTAFLAAGTTETGGGGGGSSSGNWRGKDDDDDKARRNFSNIFNQAKAQVYGGQAKGRKR